MVKSYLKYEFARSFGVVSSATANVVWSPDAPQLGSSTRRTGGGRAVVAANEEIFCWDVKKGELLSRWRDPKCQHQVTSIAQSRADPDVFAVGYEDGSIRLWDSKIEAVVVSFDGHRSAITSLAFDDAGVRLASGAKDTDVIIWDLVAEVGLFKLRGHKDRVTALSWLPFRKELEDAALDEGADTSKLEAITDSTHAGFLLTTGKDSLVKIWDTGAQQCIETHVTQTNGECWAMSVSPDRSGCITAGNDGELKVWSLDLKGLSQRENRMQQNLDEKYLLERGTLYRQGKDRALGIHFHPRQDYFAVHGSEKAVEVWRIKSDHEIQKSMARKRKRKREKAASKAPKGTAAADGAAGDENEADSTPTPEINDVFVLHVITRTGGRVRSMDWGNPSSSKSLQILVALGNNQLEYYSISHSDSGKKSKAAEPPDYTRSFAVEMPGHRTDVRSLSLSTDDRMLSSASNGDLKVWNVQSGNCVRTFECGYALCCSFLPGDRIIVVGTKTGELELYDVASASSIDTVKAHDGAVWTLRVHPDGRSMVTGSADKSAKFWKFDIVQEEVPGTDRTTPRLRLVRTRTIKVSDDVLSVCFSPDSRLLALALLDNTVKVFFIDSLKLYLNLYGHKLPVLNMDISFDSRLIVTCSADKNVRLWGLDFGDCHKAFFAHQDSIMQVSFVPHNQSGTGHHFFSVGKDRVVKHWDGDKFEQIQKMDGHHGEIWALAVGRTGDFFVTASHDKSIRVWEQTDEQIFLEEERERELEQLYESTLTASLEHDGDGAAPGDGAVVPAGKQTVETLVTGEKIMEALELGTADLALVRQYDAARAIQPRTAPPARNAMYVALGGISAEAHVQRVLERIPAASLQDALLILPFAMVTQLMGFIELFAAQGRNLPLTCRILFFLLRLHHRQLVASKTLRPMLDRIRLNLRGALAARKDTIGFNLAALRVLGDRLRDESASVFFVDGDEHDRDRDEDPLARSSGPGRTKRAFVDVA